MPPMFSPDNGAASTDDFYASAACFSVSRQPVYAPRRRAEGLFADHPGLISTKRFVAVVDDEREEIVGVVGQSYRLITNADAYEAGTRIFQTLFPDAARETTAFRLLRVDVPQLRSRCEVDLVHDLFHPELFEQETWLPFLRVTNSYDTSRALRYDIGFVRSACSNGVIFQGKVVKVRISHTQGAERALQDPVRFQPLADSLRAIEAEFIGYLRALSAVPVPSLYVAPLATQALGLTFDVDSPDREKRTRERKRFDEYRGQLRPLVRSYTESLGSTAYAAFNVATDYATNTLGQSPKGRQRVGSLQTHIGEWLRTFGEEARAPGFHVDQHLTPAYKALFA